AARAAVLPGAARGQRHADRRDAEVELSAHLAPERGVHAARPADLGGRAAAGALAEAAVVRLSARAVAGGMGGRSRRRGEGPVLRDGRKARKATRDALTIARRATSCARAKELAQPPHTHHPADSPVHPTGLRARRGELATPTATSSTSA